MSGLVLLPDTEQLLSQFLRGQDEVAELVEDRVYTVLPNSKTFPLVRVHRFSGAPVRERPLWLDRAFFQIDCWGGANRLAWQVAETCRAVCAERLVGTHDEGVITSCSFGELSNQGLDDSFTPPKHRYLFTMSVTAHPTRVAGS